MTADSNSKSVVYAIASIINKPARTRVRIRVYLSGVSINRGIWAVAAIIGSYPAILPL